MPHALVQFQRTCTLSAIGTRTSFTFLHQLTNIFPVRYFTLRLLLSPTTPANANPRLDFAQVDYGLQQ